MTEPPHKFQIAFWSNSSYDFEYLQSELKSFSAVEIKLVVKEQDLLAYLNTNMPQLLIVDELFEKQLNQLLASANFDKVNKIVMTSGYHEAHPYRENKVRVVPLEELVYFIKSLQNAQKPCIENALTSNSLYSVLVDYIKDIIFFKDVNKRYVLVNRSFSRHYKMDMIDILGKKDQELFSSDISLTAEKTDNHVLTKKRSITFDTVYQQNDSIIHLETIKTPVVSEKDVVLGIVGISRDISAKRVQEEKLRRNALLLNQSEMLTKSGSFEIKKESKNIQCSEQLRKMLELDQQTGTTLKDVLAKIHHADRKIFQEKLNDTLVHQRRNSIDHRLVISDSQAIIPCHTILNIDIGGKTSVVYGTMLDMSEIRQNQQAVLDAQEIERKTLAANLHDGLIQKLVAANMYISSLEEGTHDLEKLQIAKDLINSSIEETRRITRNLSLRNIENLGLKNALLEIIESYPLDTCISYHFDFDQNELDIELTTTIYRIFQEAIANIMKYANARHIEFTIQKSSEELLIKIMDDGVGFTPIQEAQGNGLKNIRLRVAQKNGSFNLTTDINAGVEIIIQLPII